MSVKLKDLLQDPEKLNEFTFTEYKCSSCGKTIVRSSYNLCSNCYYEKFSEEIEKHPIGGLKKLTQ